MLVRRLLTAAALAAAPAVVVEATPAEAAPARCAWLAPHLADVGLPVRTFQRIAYRESRCAPNGICVVDRDDASCSRFGVNMKTAGLRRTWARWCGANDMYDLRDLQTDLACVKAAFDRLGLRPWR